MVQKKIKTKRAQSKPAGATQKNKASGIMVRATPLPSSYPSAVGDTMVVPFKFTDLVSVPSGSAVTTGLLVLGSGTSSTGYTFLSDACAPFGALYKITTRWMLTDLKVQVRATGVGGTANTFIAASYIPSDTTRDNPPADLGELSNAHHYCESSLGTVGGFTVQPTQYFNDWRQCSDPDNSDAQAGLIQVYGSGTPGSSAVTAGVVTVSGVLHMCGLRK